MIDIIFRVIEKITNLRVSHLENNYYDTVKVSVSMKKGRHLINMKYSK